MYDELNIENWREFIYDAILEVEKKCMYFLKVIK